MFRMKSFISVWMVNGSHSVKRAVQKHRSVSYTHLRAHETVLDLVCRLLLEKKKNKVTTNDLTIQQLTVEHWSDIMTGTEDSIYTH